MHCNTYRPVTENHQILEFIVLYYLFDVYFDYSDFALNESLNQ